MISKSVLRKIVREACRAPSGDNVQPWRFRWDGRTLALYNIPGIHNPYLDFEERGAYIAHGACIENMSIISSYYGYRISVTPFSDVKDANLVAQIQFTPISPYTDPLYTAVSIRSTNHRRYKIKELHENERRALCESIGSLSQTRLVLVTQKILMQEMAYSASRAERIILEDERIAKHFFTGMNWTLAEEREKKSGFFVKTLELGPIPLCIFWLASKPKILRLLCSFGLPRFIAYQNARIYATGSVMGGIVIGDESPEQYLAAGRALERLWLTATALGMAFQPLIGTVFIAYRSEMGHGQLSAAHKKEMKDAMAKIRSIFGISTTIPALLFRAGYAASPSVRTSRREPYVEYVKRLVDKGHDQLE